MRRISAALAYSISGAESISRSSSPGGDDLAGGVEL
jgi:hypothetical protein